MDRISQLPQPLQHHILSFLEQDDFVRAMCLSQAWRSTVRSCPVLDFDQQRFLNEDSDGEELDREALVLKERDRESLFINHIQRSVQNLVGQNLSIHRFSLQVERYRPDPWHPQLNRWIQQSVDAKVEDFRLDVPTGWSYDSYVLPPFVLLSETITRLRLHRCAFDYHRNSVSLPNLLLLSLSHVFYLEQGMIEKFTSGSPKLESLQVIQCDRYITSVCVSGLPKLNFLELVLRRCLFYSEKVQDVGKVKVIAPQLRALEVSYNRWSSLNIDVCAPLLRKLTIRSKYAMEGQIDRFVSKFRGLEELVLIRSNVRSMKISNQNLRTLKMSFFTYLKRVDIDAPNLRVLKLSNCTYIERVDNINAPNLRVLKLRSCEDLETIDNVNAPNLQLLKVKWISDSLKRIDINSPNLQVLEYNDDLKVYTKLSL